MDLAIVQRAIFGGVLVGMSFALRLAYEGRSEGVSGILRGLWQGEHDDRVQRRLFVLAMALSGLVLWMLAPDAFVDDTGRPLWAFALAGLCVGSGARLANGCTSGHGVLGVARGSIRSLTAVTLFMLAAWVVVTLYPPQKVMP